MYKDQITVVINTFNSDDIIHKCIQSIPKDINILIIENSENTLFKKNLEKKYLNIKCILTGENLGYAKGNNLGLSEVKTEYALILNPDAELERNVFDNFFSTVKKLENFAIIGPAKQDNFNEKYLEKQEQIFEVESLKGYAMFLNLAEFKDVGFFDDNIFIYLEEIDLCKRLKKFNKKIFLDKKIVINHLGGKSHNKSIEFEMELSRNWHWMWSTFYFHKKHHNYFYALHKVSGKFFSSLIKMFFYFLILNNKKKKIYSHRFLGLVNSIIGKKSWYRPKIFTH